MYISCPEVQQSEVPTDTTGFCDNRHLIHSTGPAQLLPEEYVTAINRALGVSGEFKPLIRDDAAALLPGSNGNEALEDGVIDPEIPP
jgi:hypothetical protein